MARPIPQGRDRLGQLGGSHRYGVGVAGLSAVSAEFNIGLADCMIEWIQDMTCEGTGNVEVIRKYSAGTGYVIWYNSTNQRFEISLGNGVGATTYNIGTTAQLEGRRVHGHIFMDRSALAYAFVDGVLQGSVDISARAADNQDTAAACQMLYDGGGFWASPAKGLMYRVFNFGVDAGPSAADMATIAAQRFVNPDAEVALLSGRVGYATERRLDVSYVDIDQDGTTISNPGSGPDLTIGGGLHWHDVRTQAERAAIAIPGEDWYCFDSTHSAAFAGAVDLGYGATDSHVIEYVTRDVARFLSGVYLCRIWKSGNENVFWFNSAAGARTFYLTSNGVGYVATINDAGYPEYGWQGINIVHQIYNATANQYIVLVNGQVVRTVAVAADIDLSGNLTNIGFEVATTTYKKAVMAMRSWSAASLPADYATIIRRRVSNPWTTTDGFTGMTLRGNWEMKIDAVQPASSTVVVNRANPGVGNLTVSGAGTIGGSSVLAVRGL